MNGNSFWQSPSINSRRVNNRALHTTSGQSLLMVNFSKFSSSLLKP